VRILYVEDDAIAREYIRRGLSEHGYTVDVACDGSEGLELAVAGEYQLVILDVGLPALHGFDLLRELRARGRSTPVLFLSARGEVQDRVRGLNLGADDYLPKPFAFAELLARIQAIARRRHDEPGDGVLRVADLELDLRAHAARRAGRDLELTAKQFTLLEYLMRSAGQVLSHTMITERVWGHSFDPYSNVIDVHIAQLRKKIDRDFSPKLLRTVKGVGYVLKEQGCE
jgi:two-component system OmpR family response regulator